MFSMVQTDQYEFCNLESPQLAMSGEVAVLPVTFFAVDTAGRSPNDFEYQF